MKLIEPRTEYAAYLRKKQLKESDVLRRIGLIESVEENGLDVLTASRPAIVSRLNEMGYILYTTVGWSLSALTAYANWYDASVAPIPQCAVQGINRLEVDISGGVKKQLYQSLQEIKDLLVKWNPNEGYFDLPVAVLLWNGLSIDEILELRKGDISIESEQMYATVGTTRFNIENDNNSVAHDTLAIYANTSFSSRYHNGMTEVFADENGRLIRKFLPKGAPLKFKTPVTKKDVQNRLAAVSAILSENGNKPISIMKIELSGRLYRMFRLEQSVWELQDSDIGEICRMNKRSENRSSISSKVAIVNMRRTYEAYQKAFRLK